MEGCSGSSTTCTVSLHMLHGFHGQSFLFRCCKGSALDVIPPCVMASGDAKQGGSLAFCLIFMHEEAVLGAGPCLSCLIIHQAVGITSASRFGG